MLRRLPKQYRIPALIGAALLVVAGLIAWRFGDGEPSAEEIRERTQAAMNRIEAQALRFEARAKATGNAQ